MPYSICIIPHYPGAVHIKQVYFFYRLLTNYWNYSYVLFIRCLQTLSSAAHKPYPLSRFRYTFSTYRISLQGIKKSDGTSSKDFKTTKSREQIKLAFSEFLSGHPHILVCYP